MTSQEANLLLTILFADLHANTVTTLENMGDHDAVVTKITLPSGDTIKTAVNFYDDTELTTDDMLIDFSDALDSVATNEDELEPDDDLEDSSVDVERKIVSDDDYDYLLKLSDQVYKSEI
ncbi:hypothetical protein [Lentilactobacillus sp. Marseille-Q4993]|uniref:hypothetical protein n=1 Tax=Lentilactobacillus sp. Marseille-Q4993 TaxID=3039492 RepID=UPI0024BC70CE|nr:hypothetical protein [Lentilactobacillus sp. Marseille-Q4993]